MKIYEVYWAVDRDRGDDRKRWFETEEKALEFLKQLQAAAELLKVGIERALVLPIEVE